MRRMRRRLLTALLIVAAAMAAPAAQNADVRGGESPATSGIISPPLSPRNASYTIAARLDPATRTITGTETIRWRNITNRPAADLQFHLYWNAWKNTRSTFMRERALSGGGDDHRRPDEWAHIDITSMTVGGLERTASRRFIAPDDENADDETAMSVPLTQPVDPGGSVEIVVSWNAHVPRTFARTGAIEIGRAHV